MSSITGSSFNWQPQPSAWQETQNWNAKRSASISDFSAGMDAFSSAFASAMSNTITGTSSLAAQAALTRIRKKTATTLGTNTGYRAPAATPSLSAKSLSNIQQAGSVNILV